MRSHHTIPPASCVNERESWRAAIRGPYGSWNPGVRGERTVRLRRTRRRRSMGSRARQGARSIGGAWCRRPMQSSSGRPRGRDPRPPWRDRRTPLARAASRRPVPQYPGAMGLEVRGVRREEYEAAGAVTALAYKEFGRPGESGWDDYRRRIADVTSRADRTLVLVAVEEERILGTVTLELEERVEGGHERPPLAPDQAHVRMLGVHPDAQGRGIGR